MLGPAKKIRKRILIEPQWNVEGLEKLGDNADVTILIEPQWNVEYTELHRQRYTIWILIEPQWNVEINDTEGLYINSNDFNRTIVECRDVYKFHFIPLSSLF